MFHVATVLGKFKFPHVGSVGCHTIRAALLQYIWGNADGSHPILGTDVRSLFSTPPGGTRIPQEQWQLTQNGFGSPLRDVLATSYQ